MRDLYGKLPSLPQAMTAVIAVLGSAIIYLDLHAEASPELPPLPPSLQTAGLPGESAAETLPDVRTFVIFDTHELGNGEHQLTIGRQFADLGEWQAGMPSSEWCYIPLNGSGALDADLHIRRFAEGEVLDYTITDAELSAAGLGRPLVSEAMSKCVFLRERLLPAGAVPAGGGARPGII